MDRNQFSKGVKRPGTTDLHRFEVNGHSFAIRERSIGDFVSMRAYAMNMLVGRGAAPPGRVLVMGDVLSGLPGVFAGQPFLTHLWVTVPLAVTELPLSTVMLFDLGVYLAVWGAVGGYSLSLLSAVEEQQ